MVKPWMSSEDILAGARWNAEIAKHLSQTKFGVICVTPENLTAPWLVFEAGALAKTIDEKTHVCQYLIGLEEVNPQHPLSQFQCKRTTKEETFDLVRSMHSALLGSSKEVELSETQVKEAFEQWWPRLDELLQKVPVLDRKSIEEKQPDPMIELLALTKGIAQSVSALQAQVASPRPIISDGSIFLPNAFRLGNAFYPSAEMAHLGLPVRPIFMTGEQDADRATILTKYNESLEGPSTESRKPSSVMAQAAPSHQIVLICPNCGRLSTDLKGLAQNVADGKERHLTALCRNCDDREFGVHVSRSDRTVSLCPEDCPYHPSAP